MAKQTLRISYTDMPAVHDERNNDIVSTLEETYNIVIDHQNPDLLVYSSSGHLHLMYEKPLLLYITGENVHPDFTACDYALSFLRDRVGGRNMYKMYNALTDYQATIPMPNDEEALRRRFAVFIASQDSMGRGAALRKLFTQKLMEQYKHVDCPGKVLHNVDIPDLSGRQSNDCIASKLPVLNRYKFNIAFENSFEIRPEEQLRIRLYTQVAKGALDFSHELARLFGKEYDLWDHKLIIDWVNGFLQNPGRKDIVQFTPVCMSVNNTHTVYEPLLVARCSLFQFLRHPLRMRKKMKRSVWHSRWHNFFLCILRPLHLRRESCRHWTLTLFPHLVKRYFIAGFRVGSIGSIHFIIGKKASGRSGKQTW